MGAWGQGSFQNVDATDFGLELGNGGWAAVYAALHAATGAAADAYLAAPTASRALAAAEVVAAVRSGDAARLPPELRPAVAALGPLPDTTLIDAAHAALARILAQSELRELWAETGDESAWAANLAMLAEKLR